MNDEFNFEVLLCDEYQRLLNECQNALDHWNGRSEHLRQASQTGEETGRELLRLQARFAKSYSVLQRHTDHCEQCQLAARMSQNLSDTAAYSLATVAN